MTGEWMGTLEQRSLVFDEGTSDKFWSIRVDGSTHTVHYGRAGTAGQVKSKAFDAPEQAAADADRLIAEKLRKGYREVSGAMDVGQPVSSPPPLRAERAVDEPDVPAAARPSVTADDDRPPIDLRPGEWSLASWRPLHGRSDVDPRPFDAKLL